MATSELLNLLGAIFGIILTMWRATRQDDDTKLERKVKRKLQTEEHEGVRDDMEDTAARLQAQNTENLTRRTNNLEDDVKRLQRQIIEQGWDIREALDSYVTTEDMRLYVGRQLTEFDERVGQLNARFDKQDKYLDDIIDLMSQINNKIAG